MLSASAIVSLSALVLSFTTLAAAAPPAPSPNHVFPSDTFTTLWLYGFQTQDWQNKQCTDKVVLDAATNPVTRWRALGSSQALLDANEDWKRRKGSIRLSYAEEVSNFFHGRDGMLCSDVQKGNCDTPVLCSDVNHPAGYVDQTQNVASAEGPIMALTHSSQVPRHELDGVCAYLQSRLLRFHAECA